jgi:hypothetical protein
MTTSTAYPFPLNALMTISKAKMAPVATKNGIFIFFKK